MSCKRTLHFVFKIGNRKETAKFYRDVLGMKVLRHEEFEEGCKAYCNGPYDGKWSKTMIGYGDEDDHFVCELTYNYGIGQYQLGNDYHGMTIKSKAAFERCKTQGCKIAESAENKLVAEAPGGYKFTLLNEDPTADPVQGVTLGSSDLSRSLKYWTNIAGMKIFSQDSKTASLGYNETQAKLNLIDLGTEIDHQTAFGRIAIACPRAELPGIQSAAKESGNKILTELVSLDTPGKATVEVVILADPDGHEICFVGDEAFKELSKTDPKGESLLDDAMAADKSDEWYAKHKREKGKAT